MCSTIFMNGNRKFICTRCGEELDTMIGMYKHTIHHERPDLVDSYVAHIPLSFRSEDAIVDSERGLLCTAVKCSYSTWCPKEFMLHTAHHPRCWKCGKSFYSIDEEYVHEMLWYSCDSPVKPKT